MFSVATMYEDGFKEGVKWAERDIVKARPFKNYRIIKKSGRLVRANRLGFVRGYRSVALRSCKFPQSSLDRSPRL